MNKIILMLYFLTIHCFLFSQNKYGHQWLFDNFNTIDFRANSVTAGQIQPYPIYNRGASFASNICDKSGTLIMHTGGCYVINKEFKLMKYSDVNTPSTALIGYCKPEEPYGYFPFKQNNIFITYPNDSSKYLLFNMDFEHLYPNGSNILMLPPHIFYHTVDMTKDNGNGEVVEKFKIAIQDTLSRGYLIAAKHNNNRDWWVIIPKFKSNCFFVIPVTPTGVGMARKECVGLIWEKDPDLGGQVAVSADGTKYARVDKRDTIIVYNFNSTTGQFSNPILLSHPDDTESYLQGVCFSQNSRYLYVTHILKVYQYDLQSNDIQASITIVGDVSSFTLSQERGALQVMKLAPDGKIYIAGPFSHRFLCVINRPNCKGTLCDFRPYALELKYYNYGALPNNPFFEVPPANYNCDSLNTQTSEIVEHITISPNPAQLKITVSSTYIFESFSIVNLMGQNMQLGALTANEKNEIDISTLPDGIYFLQLINQKNQTKALGKFVVKK